jgi:drug/metabolite transporter (DMT)-like permease
LSALLTGERPGLATLCGGLLAICGVVLVALRGRS